jgi:hypothetical protein
MFVPTIATRRTIAVAKPAPQNAPQDKKSQVTWDFFIKKQWGHFLERFLNTFVVRSPDKVKEIERLLERKQFL